MKFSFRSKIKSKIKKSEIKQQKIFAWMFLGLGMVILIVGIFSDIFMISATGGIILLIGQLMLIEVRFKTIEQKIEEIEKQKDASEV